MEPAWLPGQVFGEGRGVLVARTLGVGLATAVGVAFGTASLHPRLMVTIRNIAIRDRVSFFMYPPFR